MRDFSLRKFCQQSCDVHMIDLQTFVCGGNWPTGVRWVMGTACGDHSSGVRVKAPPLTICRGGYDKTYNTVSTVKCLVIHLV